MRPFDLLVEAIRYEFVAFLIVYVMSYIWFGPHNDPLSYSLAVFAVLTAYYFVNHVHELDDS